MSKLKAGQVIKLWWLDSPPSFAILIEDEEGGKTDSLHCFHVGSKHNDQHASREQVICICGDVGELLAGKIYGKNFIG